MDPFGADRAPYVALRANSVTQFCPSPVAHGASAPSITHTLYVFMDELHLLPQHTSLA